jgi:AGZA family xanthine/uracil permease-like MFS transporter
MILSAATVAIIEKKFQQAAAWCWTAALLSRIGLMHSFKYTGAGTTMALFEPAWDWVIGYALMGAFLLLAPYVTEPGEGH